MKILWIILLLVISLVAQDVNDSKDNENNQIDPQKLIRYQKELSSINEEISRNIWLKRYENYKTYNTIKNELTQIAKELRRNKRKHTKYKELKEKELTLKNQLELLKEYQNSPFSELLKPKELQQPPSVKNPFDFIGAFSYIKQLNGIKDHYKSKLEDLKKALKLLRKRYIVLVQLYKIQKDPKIKQELDNLKKEIDDFEENLAIAKETLEVYNRKIEENILKVTEDIKSQSEKAAIIVAIIVGLLILSFILKWIIRKYIQDNQRAYMANKFVNFNLAFFIILILLFSYIENVSYLVTILGFASAGIAIAMKDMFMSLLGWMVIVLGGSIHVGDRIKVIKEGHEYVGDVIDISLLRITILEDVTLTSYLKNVRSGRVIFVPNNYIFTDLIANYTHLGLKTVWDSLAFNITFDSNHKKAAHIAKEVARKYAKGYTDIARKQLNKLRSTYHLKNTNVDVRVYTFAEEWGVRVSVWYQTNSYATLTLRSTISTEIIDRYLQEEDIHITYPAQKIFLTKDQKHDRLAPPKEEQA